MVTIREVARESGVSAATVSHVLNGTRRVEPETAARVRAAIEKLGYRPLREYDRYGLRGIRLAGFFAHGTGMCACADFFGLLEQRLAEHKIQLVLIAAPETIPDGELRALQRFHRLSFCVVHTSVRVPPARREAPPYEVPTVFLSSAPPPAGNSCAVSFDYRQAVRMALSHLISRGHREITIFTSIHNIDVTEEIRAGARALFADRGLEYWPSRFLNIARAVEEGNEAAQAAVDAHFARHPGLTAVAAAGTWATVHAAASLRRRGLDYPRDVSLVAIGGLYAMEESRPDLTRVDLGAPQLADAVVRALLNERMDQSRTLLLPSFLPGGSTRSLARAPSGGPAARPELLELSEDELGRIRSRRFTACIALDGAGTMFSELVLQGVRESLASLDMTLLEVAEAKGSVGMRDMQLQELVRLAPDAIISFSNDQTALRDRFLSLSAERTKLILGVDVPPDLPEYAYATCVATNETEKGRLAGRLLASEMIRRGKRKIGFVCNADINFTARQRDMSAIGTVTEDFPQLDIVFCKDFIREQNALSVVRDALEAHPETEGLYIFSADATLTAQKYLQSIGREDILLVTTQINDEIARLFLMNQNVIGIVSSQAYEMGRYLGLAAASSLLGKHLPSYVVVEPVLITAGNLEKSWVRTARRRPPTKK